MTPQKIQRVHGIYGILTAVLAVLAGVFLILACLAIYRGGEGVFSRESVWAAFLAILAPLLLFLLALIGGAVLSFVLPLPCVKEVPDRTLFLDRARVARDRLIATVDPDTVAPDIAREVKLRRILAAGGALVAAICAVPPLVYFLTFSNFPNENLSAEVLGALYVLIPCLSLSLTFLYAVSHLTALSYDRECGILRSAVRLGSANRDEKQSACALRAYLARNEKALVLFARGAVFALGVAFLILGIGNGGMNDVLQKAIRICTECIGLG